MILTRENILAELSTWTAPGGKMKGPCRGQSQRSWTFPMFLVFLFLVKVKCYGPKVEGFFGPTVDKSSWCQVLITLLLILLIVFLWISIGIKTGLVVWNCLIYGTKRLLEWFVRLVWMASTQKQFCLASCTHWSWDIEHNPKTLLMLTMVVLLMLLVLNDAQAMVMFGHLEYHLNWLMGWLIHTHTTNK